MKARMVMWYTKAYCEGKNGHVVYQGCTVKARMVTWYTKAVLFREHILINSLEGGILTNIILKCAYL